MSSLKTISGLEELAKSDFRSLDGARVALLANQCAVDSQLRHATALLAASKHCSLLKLIAPEHGFRGVHQDMEKVEDCLDAQSGLPVVSLYGSEAESLKPNPELFDDIDILIVDLPDIGSRYYTFAQSLAYSMQTAAKTGTKVLVLDRPNPLGGLGVEGAPLGADCRSFCGYAPVPQRHGLSLGELAFLMNKGFGKGQDAISPIECDLEVIAVKGWERKSWFDQTGLPWVIPSVNMPTLDTATVYPGACLFEATELSEGRGTTRPFELLGAPFIDGVKWANAVQELSLPLNGAILRPTSFIPKFQKHAETICGGVQIHVTNRETFQPFRWGLALLHTIAALYPKEFSWRNNAYEFIDKVPAIDLLYGSKTLRLNIEKGEKLSHIFDEISSFEVSYQKAREDLLLYT